MNLGLENRNIKLKFVTISNLLKHLLVHYILGYAVWTPWWGPQSRRSSYKDARNSWTSFNEDINHKSQASFARGSKMIEFDHNWRLGLIGLPLLYSGCVEVILIINILCLNVIILFEL